MNDRPASVGDMKLLQKVGAENRRQAHSDFVEDQARVSEELISLKKNGVGELHAVEMVSSWSALPCHQVTVTFGFEMKEARSLRSRLCQGMTMEG